MIIDVHTHHTRRGYLSDSWWGAIGALIAGAEAAQGGAAKSKEQVTNEFVGRMERESGDSYISAMDAAGIDIMITMGLDWSFQIGEPSVSYQQQNLEQYDLAKKHPERIFAFASIEPRRGKEGVEFFERSVKELGAKGLKLHPNSGWFANDPAAYPFYAKAVELDVPVLIHTGIDPAPVSGRHGQPIYLFDVCMDFPDLRICAAHMGDYTLTAWQDELIRIAGAFPNLFMDLSGHADNFAKDAVASFRFLRRVLDEVGRDRVLFATDYPYAPAEGLPAWVQIFKELPQEVMQAGIEFTREELDGVLGNNSLRWLGSQAPKGR